MINDVIGFIQTHPDFFIISFIFFIQWLPSLKGGWVSDDWEGISKFSDRVKDGKLQDTYEVEKPDKTKVNYRFTQFNPTIGFPASFIRWLRLNIGKKFQSVGKNEKGHDIYGYVQDPFRHHVFSLVVHYLNVILTWLTLGRFFGWELALPATILFSVHPVSTQAVAWCSGIGYLLCYMGAMTTLLISSLSAPNFLTLPTAALFSYLSSITLFCGTLNWVPLLFLGKWWFALISFVTLLISGIPQAKQIIGIRKGEFIKQNMSRSTYFNIRKPIVMVKTYWYYIKLVCFPKRLGLFHKWGYHYDDVIERADGLFWRAFIVLCGVGCLFYFGPTPVRFGIIWFVVYLLTFSNFMTAMQFVVDRYLFIPSLGFCLILAYYLQNIPTLLWIIVGLFMMRTWVHLRTFKDEVSFYESNVWNFPDSEVAKGNLGVALMNKQKVGSAVDTWIEATKDNPYYTVPHYNLYSLFRGQRQLDMAEKHMKACLDSKVVHFNDIWQKEYQGLKKEIELSKPYRYLGG